MSDARTQSGPEEKGPPSGSHVLPWDYGEAGSSHFRSKALRMSGIGSVRIPA